MRHDFKLSSSQLRTFDRALFSFLQGAFERPESRSVFVEARPDGEGTVKTIDCRCPVMARELAAEIAEALSRRAARGF
ncbi:MAG: hypothetical protein GYB36_07860 [Alphaproteobacteria bacterium]|nr:hypothetical protein [Alphaproteobacteria bacterium]